MRFTFILLFLSIVLCSCGGPTKNQIDFGNDMAMKHLETYCGSQKQFKKHQGKYAGDNETLLKYFSENGYFKDAKNGGVTEEYMVPTKADFSKSEGAPVIFIFTYEFSENGFKVTATPNTEIHKTMSLDQDHYIL